MFKKQCALDTFRGQAMDRGQTFKLYGRTSVNELLGELVGLLISRWSCPGRGNSGVCPSASSLTSGIWHMRRYRRLQVLALIGEYDWTRIPK